MNFKKTCILLLNVVLFNTVNSQKLVLEYSNIYEVNFKIYKSNEGVIKKPSNFSLSLKSTPEGLAQSYFFATNDDWNKSNYLDQVDYQPKTPKNYEAVKKLSFDKDYLKMFHKFSFIHEGNEMCYLMFIAELKGIDFKFPTCLTCIKKDNNWYIYSLSNQYKIDELLLTFKSFRLLQLINGQKTNNLKNDELIKKTRDKDSYLDVEKLYAETQTWKNLGEDQKYFTNMVDNDCNDINLYELINKKVKLTAIFSSATLKIFDKSDQKKNLDLLSNLKTENLSDSIFMISKLDFEYSQKKYSVVKYKQTNKSNKILFKTKVLDSTMDINAIPISELLYVFENLNSIIFKDLSSRLSRTESEKNEFLYKSTRGNFDSINISKIYELLKKNKSVFEKYKK